MAQEEKIKEDKSSKKTKEEEKPQDETKSEPEEVAEEVSETREAEEEEKSAEEQAEDEKEVDQKEEKAEEKEEEVVSEDEESDKEESSEIEEEIVEESISEESESAEEVKETEERIPDFRVGDTIRVSYKIIEGDKIRFQPFQGIVISKKGSDVSKTFTVRKIGADGIGVERIFPLHSPNIEKVKVVKRGKVRRAKLYYLRDRIGRKATRIKERAKKEKD